MDHIWKTTNFGHTYFPSIWIDPNYGGNILYIAGDYLGGTSNTKNHIGGIEFIDFRESNASWRNSWKLEIMQDVFFDSSTNQKTTGIFTICCWLSCIVTLIAS